MGLDPVHVSRSLPSHVLFRPMNLSWFCLSILAIISHVNAYEFLREYSGLSFFDKWDFYGSWDNLTNGAYTTLLSTAVVTCGEAVI